DPACAALACQPGSKCAVDQNGGRYCQWPSLCGACPTGATCKTKLTSDSTLSVPYCSCPDGYGITTTDCVQGRHPTVSSYSYTYVMNNTYAYTFRLRLNVCTPIPERALGLVTIIYGMDNIGDAPACSNIKFYDSNYCQGKAFYEEWPLEQAFQDLLRGHAIT
ncbi:unnamed protein product, partial [Closterium sp. NIES-64]